jgi:hypothetical protein
VKEYLSGQTADRVIGDLGQDGAEIELRIEAVELGRADQRYARDRVWSPWVHLETDTYPLSLVGQVIHCL